MAARSLTLAAVATAGLLALGGGTALALGAGSETPATPVSLTAAGTTPADGTAPGAPAPGAAPAIDRATAERIALERVGGGRITDSTELDDDDDDRRVWEVEVTNGTAEHDVDVDSATGAVVDHDTDDLRDGDDRDDNDDRDDDRADD
ncbi:peptidase YpeB-like protein [Pseudonocardia sediminis]|uniref:Peptidase YpeB-like protein n=1 Tax=Pseudonocardia sediminis TaxID=1397368 RepID=A0A4Q7V4Y3_PSEST|nr:PepSY domain-containing protein [Pseudonocardia sediminis]RZT88611.1 peptidase YpeB-like protein [Pseudonocardia sediminis]